MEIVMDHVILGCKGVPGQSPGARPEKRLEAPGEECFAPFANLYVS